MPTRELGPQKFAPMPAARDTLPEPGVPKFDVNGDRYDMDTFMGRVRHRYRLINPRGLFYSPYDLRECQHTIKQAAAGERTGFTNEELWTMKFVVDGGVHPTTNEVITPLLRMAAYVPVNIPIVLSMTMPAVVASPVATGAVHFINQSYNCMVNYANRSGEGQGVDAIAKAYVAAVALSMGGGLGATYAIKRMGGSGIGATIVRATLPFTAVVASGCANVGIMRWAEWQGEGVPIIDDEGNTRGNSQIAGKAGMYKCFMSRFLWNIPPMMMPALITIPLSRVARLHRHMKFIEAGICLVGIGMGVPLALAYFKPYASIAAADLEPQFRDLKNSKGEPVKEFTFYKGI